MNQSLDVGRFGFAFAGTGLLLYLGCTLVLVLVGRDSAILFFNSILHGIDVSTIIRMEMPMWEGIIGIVETYIIGWLIGASVASIYNLSLKI
ncbi:MAG: hypothetical protein DWQ47_11815 [Acidobacteria bacterium]|nr:MAG: hypothetical protein DWQ32_14230 [Acidobacteriota bacterium]REJ98258.1 MAG: hypothetical protein DWQ38_17030 [Acidobacteriota bacterium]REK17002.1 MAG: hypothetical protein DWQ43_02075 [Acidobacteriota bacterium]REK42912.1 MAG: hypothetical protein DWQ47_11815 [Acidobacteriota bacterium]